MAALPPEAQITSLHRLTGAFAVAGLLVGLIVGLAACQGPTSAPTDRNTPSATGDAVAASAALRTPGGEQGATEPSVTLIAAGDIGRCDTQDDERTAELAAGIEGTVLALGDVAYQSGSRREFEGCYAPSWGTLLERTLAVPGNHDHETAGAEAYFDFFGARAGPAGRGWYARTLGAWRLITLDSECDLVGGCDSGSPQHRWLTAELADHPNPCTVVAFHRPRFSSGRHGPYVDVDPLWRLAVERGVDIVLNGHEHSYERLGPIDAEGRADGGGAMVFIVGTGGAPLRGFESPVEASRTRIDDRHGLLVLELAGGRFGWAFRSAPDGTIEDEGSGTCH